MQMKKRLAKRQYCCRHITQKGKLSLSCKEKAAPNITFQNMDVVKLFYCQTSKTWGKLDNYLGEVAYLYINREVA